MIDSYCLPFDAILFTNHFDGVHCAKLLASGAASLANMLRNDGVIVISAGHSRLNPSYRQWDKALARLLNDVIVG